MEPAVEPLPTIIQGFAVGYSAGRFKNMISASPFCEGMTEISSHPSSPCSVNRVLSSSRNEGWLNALKSVLLTIYSHFCMGHLLSIRFPVFLQWFGLHHTHFPEWGNRIFKIKKRSQDFRVRRAHVFSKTSWLQSFKLHWTPRALVPLDPFLSNFRIDKPNRVR